MDKADDGFLGMKAILVAGAAGFIGMNVAERMLASGARERGSRAGKLLSAPTM